LILRADRKVASSGLIVEPLGRIVPAMFGFDASSDGYAGSLSCAREVTAVLDDCFMISTKKLLDFKLRPEYVTNLYRVADLSIRLSRSGLRNILNPRSILQRQPEAKEPPFAEAPDRALFRETWKDEFSGGDPYYNFNFGSSQFGSIQ
jgi:hypothetical protein